MITFKEVFNAEQLNYEKKEQERQMKENEIKHNKESAEVIARSQQGKHKPPLKKGDSTKRQETQKKSHN